MFYFAIFVAYCLYLQNIKRVKKKYKKKKEKYKVGDASLVRFGDKIFEHLLIVCVGYKNFDIVTENYI